MLDRTIPYKNVIMRCDSFPDKLFAALPQGFELSEFREKDECEWAEMETEIGDFDTYDAALSYFQNSYMTDTKELKKRWVLVRDQTGHVAASCIAWKDTRKERPVASLHWLIVKPKYQGLGLGKVVLLETLKRFQANDELPVYLHTQPWSYKAIYIYHQFGFALLKEDTFSHYENQYDETVEILKTVYDSKRYRDIMNGVK